MEILEAIGTDLKMSIDDLINEIKKDKTEIKKIKKKIGMIKPNQE